MLCTPTKAYDRRINSAVRRNALHSDDSPTLLTSPKILPRCTFTCQDVQVKPIKKTRLQAIHSHRTAPRPPTSPAQKTHPPKRHHVHSHIAILKSCIPETPLLSLAPTLAPIDLTATAFFTSLPVNSPVSQRTSLSVARVQRRSF